MNFKNTTEGKLVFTLALDIMNFKNTTAKNYWKNILTIIPFVLSNE
jgi:hypothetical protein